MSVPTISGMNAIKPLWSDFETRGLSSPDEEQGGQPTMFSDILQGVVDRVKETDAAKNEAEYLLSVGELDNTATLMIALSQAQSATNLLVQLRSRGLDAYNQLMNMQI